jgi:hypothetical protein
MLLGIGAIVVALILTAGLEWGVIEWYVRASNDTAIASGLSEPFEGVGFDLGLPAWVLLTFILGFPLILTVTWLTILKIGNGPTEEGIVVHASKNNGA